MNHEMVNGRNATMKLALAEVDPLETFQCLKAIRDQAVGRVKDSLHNLDRNLSEDRPYFSSALTMQANMPESVIAKVVEVEKAMKAVAEVCFERPYGRAANDSFTRKDVRYDIPLKVSAYSESFAQSVIDGCERVHAQREYARVQAHNATLDPAFKAEHGIR